MHENGGEVLETPLSPIPPSPPQQTHLSLEPAQKGRSCALQLLSHEQQEPVQREEMSAGSGTGNPRGLQLQQC